MGQVRSRDEAVGGGGGAVKKHEHDWKPVDWSTFRGIRAMPCMVCTICGENGWAVMS